jgi:hypothetical protein
MAMLRNDLTQDESASKNVRSPLLGKPSTSSDNKIRRYLRKGLMFTGQGIVGGITALQNAANAAAAPCDINPSDMSPAWFNAIDPEAKAMVIANATSAELVNAILNLLFLQVAYGILVNLWKRQGANLKEKVLVLTELLFAADSGFTLAFIAEDSFSFFPDHLNAIPATISGATNFASRLTGIDSAVMRARHFFNKDAKIQKKLAEALRSVGDQSKLENTFRTTLDDFNKAYREGSNNNTYEELLEQFLAALNMTAEPAQFQKRTTASKIASGSGLAFDALFALYLGVCAFITFMQKGYQGKEDIFWPHNNTVSSDNSSSSQILSCGSSDDDYSNSSSSVGQWDDSNEAPVSRIAQAALGGMSGFSSGALYLTRALDFRCMLYNLGDFLYENRNSGALNIGFLLTAVSLLAVANYFASSSGFNMAEKIVEAPHKAIIPMQKGSVIATGYTYGTQAGVLAVNADTCARKAFLNPPSTPCDANTALTFHAFLRKLDDSTKILITDESRENAETFVSYYNERQNQVNVSNHPASFYQTASVNNNMGYDPEFGPSSQHLTQQASGAGVDSRHINSSSLKMGSH